MVRTGKWVGLVALGALYSWLVAITRPFTIAADVTVAIAFVPFVLLVTGRLIAGSRIARSRIGGSRIAGSRIAGQSILPSSEAQPAGPSWSDLRSWVLGLALLAAVELTSYFAGFSGDRHDFPTLSSLYDEVARSHVVKGLFVFGWLALGWGLFAWRQAS